MERPYRNAHALIYDAWRPGLRAGAGASPALAGPTAPRAVAWTSWRALMACWPLTPPWRVRHAAGGGRCRRRCRMRADWPQCSPGQATYSDALHGAYKALGSRGAHVEFAAPDALSRYPWPTFRRRSR